MALALILASASGSLAAEKKHSTNTASNPAYSAFASSSPAAQNQNKHSTNAAYDVYNTRGHYVGSDPDPTVRAQLGRDSAAD
jgi:hypothetical protein